MGQHRLYGKLNKLQINPSLGEIAINSNGIYNAVKYHLDGFSTVTVNIPSKLAEYASGTIETITSGDLAGITEIRQSAFNGLTSLRQVALPEGITTINNNAFSNCTGLETINFPASLETIGNNAFAYCSSLSSDVILSDNVTSIGNNAFSSTAISSIKIGEGITSIPASACNTIQSCKTIDIGSRVTSIGNSAFYYARHCETIICRATVPPTLENQAFGSVGSQTTGGCSLYVPSESVDAYKSDSWWTRFISSERIYAIEE